MRKYLSGLIKRQPIQERWIQFCAISRVTKARQQNPSGLTLNQVSVPARAMFPTICSQKDAELFLPMCTVIADTSDVVKKRYRGVSGEPYYRQNFRVVLSCGLTELKAQISWDEDVSCFSIRPMRSSPNHALSQGVEKR